MNDSNEKEVIKRVHKSSCRSQRRPPARAACAPRPFQATPRRTPEPASRSGTSCPRTSRSSCRPRSRCKGRRIEPRRGRYRRCEFRWSIDTVWLTEIEILLLTAVVREWREPRLLRRPDGRQPVRCNTENSHTSEEDMDNGTPHAGSVNPPHSLTDSGSFVWEEAEN